MALTSASLYSEPYGPNGNIGENFRRLLGTPTLDPFQTVIREALQNVADAARLGIGPEITIRVRRLTASQRHVMRRNVFGALPEQPTSRGQLTEFLNRKEAVVMEICDFRTSGLAGPTRADRIPLGTAHTDFIDFFRNIGTPRDTISGGGTYGFGKVALYRISRCSTILADSLVAGGGDGARRIIGCHIGNSFDIPRNGVCYRYTGRHWWGHSDSRDHIVDPILDGEAEELADALGFLPRDDDRSGTSVMILDFDHEDEDLRLVGHRIVESLLWNFWPRMMSDTPNDRRFTCAVEVDGAPIDIPDPEQFPPLHNFTKAMRAARQGSGDDVQAITSLRPNKHLGILAIKKGLWVPRSPLVGDGSLVPNVSKHIALMRPVELVVKYVEGEAFPDERLEWAGVFIASAEREVERAFANSEPPAHDDWIPHNLPKGPAKTFVNVALQRIKEYAIAMGDVVHGHGNTSPSGPPLARLAGKLGQRLEGVGGDGAGSGRGEGRGGGSRPRKARATQPVFVRLEQDSECTVAVFSTDVRQDSRTSGKVLAVKATIAIDGVAAPRIDSLIQQPTVSAIRALDGRSEFNTDHIYLDGEEGRYEIYVRMPPDCAVTVNAHVLAGSDI